MSKYNELEGLWGEIVSVVPSSEVDEVAKFIGSKYIDKSQDLWEEYKALRYMLNELNIIDTTKNDLKLLSIHNIANDGLVQSSINKSSIQIPKLTLGSNLNTAKSQQTQNPIEFVTEIRDYLTADLISMVVEDIRNSMSIEIEDLYFNINNLNLMIDGQADQMLTARISKESTPRNNNTSNTINSKLNNKDIKNKIVDNNDICIYCKIAVRESEPGVIKAKNNSISVNKKIPLTVSVNHENSYVCISCKGRERRDKKLGDRLSKSNLINSESENLLRRSPEDRNEKKTFNINIKSTNNLNKTKEEEKDIEEDEPKIKSKLRNKFQAARDELHFLDDDIWLN